MANQPGSNNPFSNQLNQSTSGPNTQWIPGGIIPVHTCTSYPYFQYAGTSKFPIEPPKPIETVNTKECLVGYRAWRVQKLDGKHYLQSTYKDTIWPHREKLERGVAPKLVEKQMGPYADFLNMQQIATMTGTNDYSKGIHAVKEKHKLGELCVNYEDSRVCGTINMWGEVTETEDGYLAQYAYPKELWVMSDMDPTVIMELEDNYGVPVQVSEAVELAYKSSVDWRKKNYDLQNQVDMQRYSYNPWASPAFSDPADTARIKELEEKLAKAEIALASIPEKKPKFWEKWLKKEK